MKERLLCIALALCCGFSLLGASAAVPAEDDTIIVQMTPEEKKLYDDFLAKLAALEEGGAQTYAAQRITAFGTLSALVPNADDLIIEGEFIPQGQSQPYSITLHAGTLFIDSNTFLPAASGAEAGLHEGDNCFIVFDAPADGSSESYLVAAVLCGVEEAPGSSYDYLTVDHISSRRNSTTLYLDAAETHSLEVPDSAQILGEGKLSCGAQALVSYDKEQRVQRLFLLPGIYDHTLEINGSEVWIDGQKLEKPAIVQIVDAQSPSNSVTMLCGAEISRALGYIPLWSSLHQTLTLRQNAQTCALAAAGQSTHSYFRQNTVIVTQTAATIFNGELYLPVSFFSQLEPGLYVSIH
jgi:hypothetical protein